MELSRRSQLLAAGFSDDEVRRLVREGRLTPLRRGVYVEGAVPDDVLARHVLQVEAALAQLAGDAVVSHVSAAVLHGLSIWRVPLGRVHVTRARRNGGRCGVLVHVHTAALDPAEVVTIGGLRVTSLARTVADLARSLPFEQAVVLADSAMFHRRRDRVERADLIAALERAPRWPGSPAARRVIAFAEGLSESVGESRSRVALAAAGVAPPVLQWKVHAAATGAFIGRVDFAWPERRVVAEFDGLVKYGRTLRPGQDPVEVLVAEKVREDALRAEDLGMVRWTWADLQNFPPVAARLNSRFRATAHRQ
ncbi:type IV toxin-antitoxin system AbiEi family antitoxin domain-containing protein [Pseudonocardia kunmingensis]|uniref:Putative AbiEi antitoxin of type IV toxin-antitoxin system n=1 Tax=Pseudonocardia kunmingensis TaxID=630975 RepID=A0A543CYP5_9PSEU|nr:type IV toxin-antitoxin system AbiEi family antitoxin domain-containing protein [Pseudonocardia kunmingensis]TQM02222.1 putative AbiEi antitoxin of type IV toxin-antitoxin system [Pseudonocardia kunmingensis]